MKQHTDREITAMLQSAANGDPAGNDTLFRWVEDRLRRIAEAKLRRESPGHSLQATILVDDAFCKLIATSDLHWEGREQFFAFAARVMRQLLVNHAHRKMAVKRGGGENGHSVRAENASAPSASDPAKLVELNDALESLRNEHPEAATVFELNYFGGWTIEQIAEQVLDVSASTVKRRLKLARGFLVETLYDD